jgi:hypothetical protein
MVREQEYCKRTTSYRRNGKEKSTFLVLDRYSFLRRGHKSFPSLRPVCLCAAAANVSVSLASLLLSLRAAATLFARGHRSISTRPFCLCAAAANISALALMSLRAASLCRGYGLCGAAVTGSSRRSGRTEKNLLRHGSQRSAGNPSSRPKKDITPGTSSGEMRCNSRLPQIRQCA